jgi:phosphatidylglycerophosphatase C
MIQTMKGQKTLALFDFDGTITTRDSFVHFFEYYAGFFRFWIFAVLTFPISLGKILGFVSATNLKEFFMTKFIKGVDVEKLDAIALKYSEERLPRILKTSALKEIERHVQQNHDVALVSASTTLWLKDFAAKQGMELIVTELEVADGCYTGKISGKNCLGPQKVVRIKEKYDLSAYDEIFAYGDTSGDKEMLEIADKKHFRYFN